MQSKFIIYAVLAGIAIYIAYRYSNAQNTPKTRPNIVVYYATWCPASRAFLPVWEQVRKMTLQQSVDIDINALNCDGANNPNAVKVDVSDSVTIEPETSSAYGVNSYPTIIMYNGGNEVRFNGSRTPENLLSFIKANL